MMFAALAAILLGVCTACNAPQQDNQRKDLTKTKKSMTNKELKEKLTLALEDMKAKAIEMGIHGVAVASVLNNGDSAEWMGEMKVVGTPLDLEGGYNLVAVAWSKCAEVIATMADSGNPEHKTMTGELGYTGGAYGEHEGCKMAFAFSGAESEEDLVVARYGIEKLKGYISSRQESDTTTNYKPLATPLKKDQFIQVTIVVNDIRRAAKAWAALLGVPEPEIWVNHLKSNGEYPYTYRGNGNMPCDLQMCVIEMGDWVLELHQIDENPSTFREFINKHGQGVHHLGFEVGNARDEVIRELKQMGFDTERTIGIYPGSSWTIVDSEDVLGVNLNIKPKR